MKKIGIDLDGVVFDSETMFMTEAELYDVRVLHRNSLVAPEEPRVQKKYAWTKEETDEYICRYSVSDAFGVIPGAKEVISLLRESGCKIYFISARGQFDEREKVIALRKLDEAGIRGDAFIWGKLDKLDVCLNNGIDAMIDDRYDVCDSLCRHGILCLYYQSLGRKQMKSGEHLVQVHHWGEIYRELYNRGWLREKTDEKI